MIASRHGRRPYILRALAASAVMTALVGGCTSGSSSSSAIGSSPVTVTSSAPTVSVTPSPSPSPTQSLAPPVLPAAAKQPTQAGAEAFYRYFWDVYSYSFLALETTRISAISDLSTCTFCTGVVGNIDKAVSQNLHYEGGVVSSTTVVAAPGDARKGLLLNGLLDQTASSTVDAAGAKVASNPSRTKSRVDAAVRWKGDHWVALEVKVAVK